MYNNLYTYISVIFLAILTLIVYVEILCNYHKKVILNEYNRSIIYQLYQMIKTTEYTEKSYVVSIIFVIISVTLWMMYIYPKVILNLFVPIVILIFFDFIFLYLIVPSIKVLILDVDVVEEKFSKKSIFNNKIEHELNSKCNREIFMLSTPSVKDNSDPSDILDIQNLIWTIQLFDKKRHFIYTSILMIISFIFLILLHKIYYMGVLGNKNGYFVFIFFTIWLIYVVVRLRYLVGFEYFLKLFSSFLKVKYFSYLRYMTIYKINETTGQCRIYTIKNILKDLRTIKFSIGKNIEYFIGLASTVLYIAILTFVLSTGQK